MEEIDINNILDGADAESLFSEDIVVESGSNNDIDKQKETPLVEIDPDNLFDLSESVDEDGKDKGLENTSSKESSSPNFYSSIASALLEDGIFTSLTTDELKDVNDSEKFKETVEKEINARLDEKQKRINEALELGVEPTEVKRYEEAISYLNSIKDVDLTLENDQGESLRKQLIKQDFLNRGYSEERAEREVKKSFTSGDDIEDAKEALKSNLEYFQKEYSFIVNEAKESEKQALVKREEQSKLLQKSILEESILGEATWEKSIRQKSYDAISKPIHKDKDTGELLTAVQKYQRDSPNDFLKAVGLLYTVTDGFKDLKGLLGKQVNKQVKNNLKELENKLSNTVRDTNGNLQFVTGVNDNNSKIGKDWNIDA